MASAWNSAWGSAWGNSWGSIAAAPATAYDVGHGMPAPWAYIRRERKEEGRVDVPSVPVAALASAPAFDPEDDDEEALIMILAEVLQ